MQLKAESFRWQCCQRYFLQYTGSCRRLGGSQTVSCKSVRKKTLICSRHLSAIDIVVGGNLDNEKLWLQYFQWAKIWCIMVIKHDHMFWRTFEWWVTYRVLGIAVFLSFQPPLLSQRQMVEWWTEGLEDCLKNTLLWCYNLHPVVIIQCLLFAKQFWFSNKAQLC